jgi:MarR family transcriptional regulator, 2-MHQ and catechol-resistance regulon repressor
MNEEKDILKLTTVLFRTMNNVEAVIKKDIKGYQLNATEFGTLELLYNRGSQPIQSICNRLLMANSSMTYTIDKLEDRGLITRVVDEQDRRNTLIDLSNEGKTFFDSIFPNHIETLQAMYQKLTNDEIKTLIESLKKIGYEAMRIHEVKK